MCQPGHHGPYSKCIRIIQRLNVYKFEQTRAVTPFYKLAVQWGLPVLTPEIMELCQQASVEQDADRLIQLIREINRLIDLRRKHFRPT